MNVSEALQTGQGVQLSEALSFGGLTAVTGMSIVFGVLVVRMIVLYLFKLIFYKDSKKTAKPVEDVKETPVVETKAEDDVDDDELIAILTAAVAASLNTSTYNLNIKSYRRINDVRPAWNKQGLRETIESRF